MVFDFPNVPECILSHVFSKLTSKERMLFRLTCKHWNRIITTSANPSWMDLLIHNEDQDLGGRAYPVVEYLKLGSKFDCQQSAGPSDRCCHRECIQNPDNSQYIHLCYLDDLNKITYPVMVRNLKLANLDQNEIYSSQLLVLQDMISSNKAFRRLQQLKIGLVKVSGRIFRSVLMSLPTDLFELEISNCDLSDVGLGEAVERLRRRNSFQVLTIINCLIPADQDSLLFGITDQACSGSQTTIISEEFRVNKEMFTRFVKHWRETNPTTVFKRINFQVDDDLRTHLILNDGISVHHDTRHCLKITTRHLPTIDRTCTLTTVLGGSPCIQGITVPDKFNSDQEITISYRGNRDIAVTSKVQSPNARVYPRRFLLTEKVSHRKIKLIIRHNAPRSLRHFPVRFYFTEATANFSWAWFDANMLRCYKKNASCYLKPIKVE